MLTSALPIQIALRCAEARSIFAAIFLCAILQFLTISLTFTHRNQVENFVRSRLPVIFVGSRLESLGAALHVLFLEPVFHLSKYHTVHVLFAHGIILALNIELQRLVFVGEGLLRDTIIGHDPFDLTKKN